jgi:choline dehydrogenase-like flavoprotein
MKDRILGAINSAQSASAGTKQLEKSRKIVTHAEQLAKVLLNWSDPKNDRPSHTVENLVTALMKSSGIFYDRKAMFDAIPDDQWAVLMDAYMAWQDLTESVVAQFIVAPLDEAEGNTASIEVTRELSELEQLSIALGQAIKDGDKSLAKEIQTKIANLA